MKKFEEKQFTAYYNKLMLATLGVVLLISFALIGLQVRQQARHEEAQLAEQFKTRSIAIDNLIVSVSEHLKLMQRQAEAYFLDPTHGASRLHAALGQTDAVQYSLDQIPLPYAEPDVGNLTGQGSLAHLPPDIHEEMEMALGLNRLFKGVQTNIPNAAWVYYTSQRKFSNIYPWVPSSRARFTEAFYLKPFYSLGLPANNPKREIRWTPLYIDEYGKGMMVTATQPIYRGADFLGTVSIVEDLAPRVPHQARCGPGLHAHVAHVAVQPHGVRKAGCLVATAPALRTVHALVIRRVPGHGELGHIAATVRELHVARFVDHAFLVVVFGVKPMVAGPLSFRKRTV